MTELMTLKLLSRDEFRAAVFARDHNTCIVPGCNTKAHDAHHIIERRLWTEEFEQEGYFIENGASLCERHHRFGAETCVIQPQALRFWLNIPQVAPHAWDGNESYDKWGVVLKRPTRQRIKYPSTPYLPMSPGSEPNDINLTDVTPFINQHLVVTIKMDGSNTMLTNDLVAARNGSHASHPSFDWLKAWHVSHKHLIPDGVQVFGENLYAKHSIHYATSTAYPNPGPVSSLFQVFAVYDQKRELFYGWEEVKRMADWLGVPTVPVLTDALYVEKDWELHRRLLGMAEQVITSGHEGLVVRTWHPFPYGSFEGYETRNSNDGRTWKVNAIAKYVRPNHVQTDEHWSHGTIVRNEVKK